MKRSVPIAMGIAFGLGALALGSSWAVNQGIASFLAIPEGEGVPDLATAAAAGDDTTAPVTPDTVIASASTVRDRTQYIDQIMRRNLFDSEAIASWNPKPDGSNSEDDTPVSDIDVKLLATAISEPSTFSQALLVENRDGAIPRGYRIGDDLYGAEIVNIEPQRVTIRRNGNLEYITTEDSGRAPAPAASTSSSSSSSGDDEVQEVGENSFVVSQDLIDTYINDLEAISRMGRALLHRGPDGQFDGYRMSAIRRDTLPDKLGIKNGDIIHAVNGMDLNSMQGAMSAYQTLQNEKSFNFEVTRRGKRIKMSYEVQ